MVMKRPVLFARDWVQSGVTYTFHYGESEPDPLAASTLRRPMWQNKT